MTHMNFVFATGELKYCTHTQGVRGLPTHTNMSANTLLVSADNLLLSSDNPLLSANTLLKP